MVKSVLYRTKPLQWYLFVSVYFWYRTPTSHPLIAYLISNSVPLVYLLTHFYYLCLLLTSLFHLFFWLFFPLILSSAASRAAHPVPLL